MPRGETTFRQRDLRAALKAAKDAGVEVARIEINRDGFTIVTGKPSDASAQQAERNECLEELKELRAKRLRSGRS